MVVDLGAVRQRREAAIKAVQDALAGTSDRVVCDAAAQASCQSICSGS